MITRASLGLDVDLAFSTIQAALKNRPDDVVRGICTELAKLNAQAAKRVAKDWPWRATGESFQEQKVK